MSTMLCFSLAQHVPQGTGHPLNLKINWAEDFLTIIELWKNEPKRNYSFI